MEDFSDVSEIDVRPTRGTATIDRIFVNFGGTVSDRGSVSPLDVDLGEPGSPSDHRVAFTRCDLKRIESFEWISYKYLYYNHNSVDEFGRYLGGISWRTVLEAVGSTAKAQAYQDLVTAGLESCFPTIATRRKSTDLPWINNRIRRLIRQRRAIFRQEGRSRAWRNKKKKTDELIRSRRDTYFAVQKKIILADDGSRVFFKNVKRYKSADKPTVFDVKTLCPGDPDLEVAEKLAENFNSISHEFSSLEPRDVPHNPSEDPPDGGA